MRLRVRSSRLTPSSSPATTVSVALGSSASASHPIRILASPETVALLYQPRAPRPPLTPATTPRPSWAASHTGWCSAEETVLPTFAWQRFPSLVAQSQPPLLARTLSMVSCGNKTSCAPCHRSPGSLASLVAFARRSSNWCGIKIARDDNEEMMRAVLTDVLRCRGRCKPGGPEGIGRAHSVAREDDWPCWSADFWKRVDSDHTSTP